MLGIRGELEQLLKDLHFKIENCNQTIAKYPDGSLYRHNMGKTVRYFHATMKDGGYSNSERHVIQPDSLIAKQLARKRFLEQLVKHYVREEKRLANLIKDLGGFGFEELMRELPKAYQGLPESYFAGEHLSPELDRATEIPITQFPDKKPNMSGIYVPESLKEAARADMLTDRQRKQIREIQREWANQPYEINTKKQAMKKVITSQGLRVRSKSEGLISERLYYYDIPFRHDQVLHFGNRRASPDFTFFSILTGEHYWEHAGKTSDDDYVDYHLFKTRQYAGNNIFPWTNYIETFDEPDGFFDGRIVETEITSKLMRRLQLA